MMAVRTVRFISIASCLLLLCFPCGEWALATPNPGQGNILTAVGNGDLEAVRAFLASGGDVNRNLADGNTLLLYAVIKGQSGVTDLLLKSGADPNHHDSFGHTPLIEAARLKRHGIAKLLLTHGAKVNDGMAGIRMYDYKGWTPLHFAADAGDVAMVKLLLAHRAKVNARNKRGKTPITCTSKPEVIAVLKRAGAK
jgi:ankyrin repeat protein